jgi:hypothetical protein
MPQVNSDLGLKGVFFSLLTGIGKTWEVFLKSMQDLKSINKWSKIVEALDSYSIVLLSIFGCKSSLMASASLLSKFLFCASVAPFSKTHAFPPLFLSFQAINANAKLLSVSCSCIASSCSHPTWTRYVFPLIFLGSHGVF